MIRIELGDAEASVLHDVLDNVLSDLGMEIADTDSLDFREQLHRRKQLLEGVLRRLDEAARGQSDRGEG